MDYVKNHPDESIEIVDLRSLQPWDKEAVESSVKKTGRVLILHEDTLTNGFGGEIAAHLAENCFSYLDAPIMRCASLDTAIPMNKALEDQFLAKARLEEMMEKLLKY
jgi:2-oxoisovalerate dehydrogenase E1 component